MENRTILRSISTIILFYLVNFGLWEVFVFWGMRETWASFAVYAILIVIVILIWHSKLKLEWYRFRSKITNWKKFFIEIIVWLIVASAVGYVLQYFVNGAWMTENTQNVTDNADAIPAILSLIMMSGFTPFIEELTFRQSLIGFVESKNKRLLCIMVVASIFAFDTIHIYQWQEFFYYLPITICLTAFYLKHNRNIFSSIIMHALANLPFGILMIVGVL